MGNGRGRGRLVGVVRGTGKGVLGTGTQLKSPEKLEVRVQREEDLDKEVD